MDAVLDGQGIEASPGGTGASLSACMTMLSLCIPTCAIHMEAGKAEEEVMACGIICRECNYYKADCEGCRAVKGAPFWVAFPDIRVLRGEEEIRPLRKVRRTAM
jgi:hypothetical protein